MLTGLNHLTLAVSDLERSFGFYTDVLGLIPRAKWSNGAYLSLGELWLCLAQGDVKPKQDYTHYAFSVADSHIAHFREKLRATGVIEWQDNKSEGKSVYFLDPDGHRLEAHYGTLETRLQACKQQPYEGMVLY